MKPLALIAAGGEGKRLGSIGPKALVRCGQKTLLGWSLTALAKSESFGHQRGTVVVAAHASELEAFERIAAESRGDGLEVVVTAGGPSRSHSVAAALKIAAGLIEVGGPVLVHDAARIFTSAKLIDRLVSELGAADGSLDCLVPASPVTDTIKLVDDQLNVTETPPRERLWAVQTPQAFRYQALATALGVTESVDDTTLAAASDDASLIEARGGKVRLLAWSEPNGKITTAEDLAAAELLLSRSGA